MESKALYLRPYSEEEMKFSDVSRLEDWREYVFKDGSLYRINKPALISVKRKPEGDSHRVIDADGIRHYIPAGWIAMRFSGQWGLG